MGTTALDIYLGDTQLRKKLYACNSLAESVRAVAEPPSIGGQCRL